MILTGRAAISGLHRSWISAERQIQLSTSRKPVVPPRKALAQPSLCAAQNTTQQLHNKHNKGGGFRCKHAKWKCWKPSPANSEDKTPFSQVTAAAAAVVSSYARRASTRGELSRERLLQFSSVRVFVCPTCVQPQRCDTPVVITEQKAPSSSLLFVRITLN